MFDAGAVTPSKFKRGRKWSLHGCVVTFIYLCAFGFYLYVRIAKTLDLGSYVWYGAIVLAIEIAGATTTLVWCLNIVMDPVHEPLKMDPDNPGLTLVCTHTDTWSCCCCSCTSGLTVLAPAQLHPMPCHRQFGNTMLCRLVYRVGPLPFECTVLCRLQVLCKQKTVCVMLACQHTSQPHPCTLHSF